MRLELRMKYLETIYQRYHRASKRSKGRILDELCKVCKYSRKYAIWRLNRLREEEGPKVHKARHRGKKYDHRGRLYFLVGSLFFGLPLFFFD